MDEKKKFDQFTYQNQYIRGHYDRINLLLPKGKKEEVKKRSAQLGMSVNEYINALINNDMKI